MTPLTKLKALELVKSWQFLPFYPRDPKNEGLENLTLKFMEITGTLEYAEKLSNLVKNACPRCPVPLELRRIMDAKVGPPADGISKDDMDRVAALMDGGGGGRKDG